MTEETRDYRQEAAQKLLEYFEQQVAESRQYKGSQADIDWNYVIPEMRWLAKPRQL